VDEEGGLRGIVITLRWFTHIGGGAGGKKKSQSETKRWGWVIKRDIRE
jgi:hypothetical protein